MGCIGLRDLQPLGRVVHAARVFAARRQPDRPAMQGRHRRRIRVSRSWWFWFPLLVLLSISCGALAQRDSFEVRHGPYFNYLWSNIHGPTFDGANFEQTRAANYGYYVGQTSSTTGYEVGYEVRLGNPLGPSFGFALDFARWPRARLQDFTAPSSSAALKTYSNASVSYSVVDLLLSLDLVIGAVYGGLGAGKRSMSFSFQQQQYDDWEVAFNWVVGLRVSPVTLAVSLLSHDERAVGWARTFDLSALLEWRFFQGSQHCEGVAYTDHCGGTEVVDTRYMHMRSFGVGLSVDVGALILGKWEDWGKRREERQKLSAELEAHAHRIAGCPPLTNDSASMPRLTLESGVITLEGTSWTATDSDGFAETYSFCRDGVLRVIRGESTSSYGTWKQVGASVSLEINDHYWESSGTISGRKMEGAAKNRDYKRWTWTATLLGHAAEESGTAPVTPTSSQETAAPSGETKGSAESAKPAPAPANQVDK
jgi:hypothetical protein